MLFQCFNEKKSNTALLCIDLKYFNLNSLALNNMLRVCVCSCEFTEVQTLYRQSTEHAAEQSHLIKQLEGLNLDTQKVLRNQEESHTADTTSYQRVHIHTHAHMPNLKVVIIITTLFHSTQASPAVVIYFQASCNLQLFDLPKRMTSLPISCYCESVFYLPSLSSMTVLLFHTQHYTITGNI